jgi:hypothetical protein
MTPEERCEAAVQAKEPERALRALVLDLAKEGRSKAAIYDLLENVLARLRVGDASEEREDAILNVMDALTGWCHPNARLLPDDSSLAPSRGTPEEK